MELISKLIKELDIHPENLCDDIIENTNIYSFVVNKYNLSKSNLSAQKLGAIKLVSYELIREDNHGASDFSVFKSEIEDWINNVNNEEFIELCKNYLDISTKLEIITISDSDYIIGENIKLGFNQIATILSKFVIQDLNLSLYKVKLQINRNTFEQEWHELFEVEDDYNKERINTIVNSIVCN